MRQARPAHELVVIQLGQLVPEGRRLGVLVDLTLPAPGDGTGGSSAVRDDEPVLQAPGQRLGGVALLAALRAEDRIALLELRGSRGDVARMLVAQPGGLQGGQQGHREQADGGARLAAPGDEHQRHALRLGVRRQATAGGHADGGAAARTRLRRARERFFGLSRVAHEDDQRLRTDPLGERVAAHDGGRHGEVGQGGESEVGADGGATHPADGEPVGLGGWDRREGPEEGAGEPLTRRLVAVAKLLRQRRHLGEHARAVDGRDSSRG